MLKSTQFIFIILLLHLCYFKAFSQSQEKSQALFLELGGSAASYSMNFDTRFTSKANGLGGRIGIGYLPSLWGSGGLTAIPLVINYLIGEKKHFLEVGAGATYFSLRGALLGLLPYNESGVEVNLAIGYRFVSDSGFTFRAGLTPLFGKILDEGSEFMPQISFGYSF